MADTGTGSGDEPRLSARGLYVLGFGGDLWLLRPGSRTPESVLAGDVDLARGGSSQHTDAMALVPERDEVFLVRGDTRRDPADLLVVVLSTRTGTVVDTLRGIAPTGDGMVYDTATGTVRVASEESVVGIDVDTRRTIRVPLDPGSDTGSGLAVDAVRGVLYVAQRSRDRVSVVDTDSHRVVDVLAVESPTQVVADEDGGSLWVVSETRDGDTLTELEPP
jgi:hypothetical protein